jgi:GT2 family glycosyltransferase
VVIPLYGDPPLDWRSWIASLLAEGFLVVLVENNVEAHADCLGSQIQPNQLPESSGLHLLHNNNKGGVAGGFNRGVEHAIGLGAHWVTLLDQDSRLESALLKRLLEPWRHGATQLLVGPMILDGRYGQHYVGQPSASLRQFWRSRLLISSGTSFSGGRPASRCKSLGISTPA